MTQQNDHEKLMQVREQLPVCKEMCYLNTGTCGPLPQVSAQAMNLETQRHTQHGRASIPVYIDYLQWLDEVRERAGRMLGAAGRDIALTHHTTEGMNIVLWGFDWQPGDAIVTSTHEHGGLLAPLAMLHQRFGVEILYLPFNGEPEHDCALLEDAMASAHVRMLALSHVSYIEGFVYPIKELATLCRISGCATLIDGAQSVGAIPVDVHDLDVDFYASPGQKWLWAPEGTGFLYVSPSWLSRLRMTYSGFFSYHNMSWFAQDGPHFVPANDARRFHIGGFCRQAIYGLEASLRWLEEEVGWDWIFARHQHLMAYARKVLGEVDGVSIVTPVEREATLLSFRVDGWEAVALRNALDERGFLVRDIPVGEPVMRISVGCFLQEEELDALASCIRELIEKGQ